ncbi:hypothetical protein [Chromobacterium alticapitis]|uniref:UrcA family protein n=1 Tax=Chromobacterium alticapitis TaxID=2073169 RepID=A0A2S5DFG4_9NEIS|nr:hypothetical protein [Chromobacterium alticapitis]POZ61769.1 hypothetical protein C2I19_12105 [Chromobacterium alticapitis]
MNWKQLSKQQQVAAVMITFALTAWPAVGIDMPPAAHEYNTDTRPALFLKHRPSLALTFESPITPADAMAGTIPAGKREAFLRYCGTRYGTETAEDCLTPLQARLRDAGFTTTERR